MFQGRGIIRGAQIGFERSVTLVTEFLLLVVGFRILLDTALGFKVLRQNVGLGGVLRICNG